MAYCTQQDLENALGVQLVRAVYDDDNDGEVDAAPIAACLEYATAECDSFLRGTYAVPFTATPFPAELRYAALDFACAYTARRRPELAHTLGTDPFKQFYDAATAKMKRFDASEQRLPAASGTPDNIGGYVRSSYDDTADEDAPARSFDDMGDY